MKVLFLASAGELGGAEWVVLDLLKGLRAAKPDWQLELIVPGAGGLQPRAAELGVAVTVLPWGSRIGELGDASATNRSLPRLGMALMAAIPEFLRHARRFREAIRSARPDVIHAHGFKMQLLAMYLAPRGLPIVLHLHDYIAERPMMSRLLNLRRRRRMIGVAISRSIALDATHALGDSIPIRVIHNAVDPGEMTPEGPRLDLDRLAGLPPAAEHTVRVGLVATMARWKGQETFLRALALLGPASGVRGYVVGGPIYTTRGSQYSLEELRRIADELDLASSVGFTGRVDDPAAAMRSLDIVVHASTRPEPFGRVIVEAMALERAVITTGIGGAAELIEPGRSAEVVAADDPAALANAIRRLAESPAERADLGREGRLRVTSLFGHRQMIDAVLDLYASVLRLR